MKVNPRVVEMNSSTVDTDFAHSQVSAFKVDHKLAHQPVDGITDAFVAKIQRLNATNINVDMSTVGGLPALRVVWDFPLLNDTGRMIQLMVINSNTDRGYIITCAGLSHYFESYVPTFNHMISSFKFD
jgi:hypothetical protein